MLDPDSLPGIRAAVRAQTQLDRGLLDDLRADARRLRDRARALAPRRTTAVSVVASDGGNNRLEFDPFSIQLVRVVDSYGKEFMLDALSPTTNTADLSRRHFHAGAPTTALGRMMADLGVGELAELSPMIPSGRRQREDPGSISGSWVQVYRDMCEWAVLYERVIRTSFATDTLLVRDGLLRAKVFDRDLFMLLGKKLEAAIERVRREDRRRVFLVGVAKRSRVLDRYRVAMLVEDALAAGQPRYVHVPRDIEAKAYEWEEYARGAESGGDGEAPKFVLGDLHLVRFGPREGDPVWPVDVFSPQIADAPETLGYLLADAVQGFPVPYYPQCLQRAHEHAQVVDLDLTILQDEVIDAVRDLLPAGKRDVLDRVLLREDVARLRYG